MIIIKQWLSTEMTTRIRRWHVGGSLVGIISLGKKDRSGEGEESSLDKQTYGAILREIDIQNLSGTGWRKRHA